MKANETRHQKRKAVHLLGFSLFGLSEA